MIVDQKYEIEPSSAADSYSIQYVVVLAAHVSPLEPILVFVVRNPFCETRRRREVFRTYTMSIG